MKARCHALYKNIFNAIEIVNIQTMVNCINLRSLASISVRLFIGRDNIIFKKN